MPVQPPDIRIFPARHLLKIPPAVKQEQRAVFHKVYIGGILRFFDLKAENIPVKADHLPHILHKKPEAVQSHTNSFHDPVPLYRVAPRIHIL